MKVGNYTIPRFRLKSLMEDTKKIYETTSGKNEFHRTDIAYALNQTPASGTLAQKIADMKSYGLIQGRGETLSVSKQWIDAVFALGEERNQAIDKIFRNVPLWGILYDKFGDNIKEENFYAILSKITGADYPESQKKAGEVRKSYIEDVKYVLSVKTPDIGARSKISQEDKLARDRNEEMETTVQQKAGFVHINFPGCCDAKIDLHDAKSLDIVESLLEAIRAKIGIETPKKSINVSDDTVENS